MNEEEKGRSWTEQQKRNQVVTESEHQRTKEKGRKAAVGKPRGQRVGADGHLPADAKATAKKKTNSL
jgi:hypothetical protein